ncbi:uncharacterized protein LOC134687189 [Mytilus trossulus]|uniref:uncharacterized protein LOC134687189 n=1 Tax=Mytilus trossulus TaxID=6551 RepID=UPI003004E926
MMLVLLICFFVGQSLAATTMAPHSTKHHNHHGTRPTHEPAVTESFGFKYDPHSHMMAAMTHHKCYLYTMVGTESADVHTTHGLHLLETKLITMVDDTTMTYSTMTHDELTAVSKLLSHSCNKAGWTTYKLN